jgi:hypothetical protein
MDGILEYGAWQKRDRQEGCGERAIGSRSESDPPFLTVALLPPLPSRTMPPKMMLPQIIVNHHLWRRS